MPSRFFLPLAMALAMGLGGCAQTTWQTEKYVAADRPAELKRLFIVYAVATEKYSPNLPSVKSVVTSRLQSCGISSIDKTVIMTYGEPPPTPSFNDPNLVKFNPDSQLVVMETKKDSSTYYGLVRQDMARYYTASLFDVRSQKLLWRSNLYLSGTNGLTHTSSEKRGEALGKDLVDFLEKDGIVHGCPPAATN